MKQKLAVALATILALIATACHDTDSFPDSTDGNLEALWTILNEHYCFFEEKNIDWDEVLTTYRARLKPSMSQRELFDLCAEMLDLLQDGHVNLISSFNTSSYRGWWAPYPQDFNLRTLQEYYLNFDYSTTAGMTYKVLRDSIGYIYYPSFSTSPGNTNLDWVLSSFKDCHALIIDIRNNGGGLLTNIDTFVGRFIEKKICGGYIRHKLSAAHGDFSEPQAITYEPADAGRIMWLKPIVLITNRSTYSAANAFASVMKSLPNVTLVGAMSGGGGGLPFSSELPNGWSVRFSACPMTNADGESIEEGIAPDIEVHSTDADLSRGIDAILDRALTVAAQSR